MKNCRYALTLIGFLGCIELAAATEVNHGEEEQREAQRLAQNSLYNLQFEFDFDFNPFAKGRHLSDDGVGMIQSFKNFIKESIEGWIVSLFYNPKKND